MAEHSYNFLNSVDENRTVRTCPALNPAMQLKLRKVLEASSSPASHAPDRWGEISLIYGFDDMTQLRVAGITVEETRQFVLAIGRRAQEWELRDDWGLCMAGKVLPSGPDFSRMDARAAK